MNSSDLAPNFARLRDGSKIRKPKNLRIDKSVGLVVNCDVQSHREALLLIRAKVCHVNLHPKDGWTIENERPRLEIAPHQEGS